MSSFPSLPAERTSLFRPRLAGFLFSSSPSNVRGRKVLQINRSWCFEDSLTPMHSAFLPNNYKGMVRKAGQVWLWRMWTRMENIWIINGTGCFERRDSEKVSDRAQKRLWKQLLFRRDPFLHLSPFPNEMSPLSE